MAAKSRGLQWFAVWPKILQIPSSSNPKGIILARAHAIWRNKFPYANAGRACAATHPRTNTGSVNSMRELQPYAASISRTASILL